MKGQAIVELAIVMPILLAIIAGIGGMGYLFLQALRAQNGVAVLAEYAATDPGWRSRVAEVNAKSGCHADPLQPALVDDVLTWTCHYHLGWAFVDDLVPVLRVSAIVGPTATPEPSPS